MTGKSSAYSIDLHKIKVGSSRDESGADIVGSRATKELKVGWQQCSKWESDRSKGGVGVMVKVRYQRC